MEPLIYLCINIVLDRISHPSMNGEGLYGTA